MSNPIEICMVLIHLPHAYAWVWQKKKWFQFEFECLDHDVTIDTANKIWFHHFHDSNDGTMYLTIIELHIMGVITRKLQRLQLQFM